MGNNARVTRVLGLCSACWKGCRDLEQPTMSSFLRLLSSTRFVPAASTESSSVVVRYHPPRNFVEYWERRQRNLCISRIPASWHPCSTSRTGWRVAEEWHSVAPSNVLGNCLGLALALASPSRLNVWICRGIGWIGKIRKLIYSVNIIQYWLGFFNAFSPAYFVMLRWELLILNSW